MSKRVVCLIFVLLMTAILLPFTNNAYAISISYFDLATHWAPKVYQDVNDTYSRRADFISKFNYDGDWVGNNNWDNLYNYPQYAYVYYTVQETETHYFIGYYFFHPRDDALSSLDRHENDMEGMLVVVRKDGTLYGSFQLMETQAHNHWYQYTNDSSMSSGSDNVDGGVLFDGSHPEVFIQANGLSPSGGHGVKAYDGSSAPGGDGIVYHYTGTAESPEDATGDYTHSYGYALVSMDEIWERRYDTGGAGHTFQSFGIFDGDDGQADSCTPPWNWDDPDDGAVYIGTNFADPAMFIDVHLEGLGNFSHTYVYNSYYSYKITITDITCMVDRDGWGAGDSDIYAYVTVNDNKYVTESMWKKNEVPVGQKRIVLWGHDDAEDGMQYSEDFNYVYVVAPPHSQVVFNVYDADGTSGDDFMGRVQVVPASGQTVLWTDVLTSNSEAKISASVYAVD